MPEISQVLGLGTHTPGRCGDMWRWTRFGGDTCQRDVAPVPGPKGPVFTVPDAYPILGVCGGFLFIKYSECPSANHIKSKTLEFNSNILSTALKLQSSKSIKS